MTRAPALSLLACVAVLALSPALAAGQAAAASEPLPPEPGSELRVWLLTMGPGDAVWERFGHNALRVLDTSTGRDVAYNWGIFDFNQVDFIPRFLKGQMLYMMAPFQTGPMVQAYAGTGRQVVAQELFLTPAQRLLLRDLAEHNALPENRDYAYNYFLDNCSTRVRDLLDQVLGGALSTRFRSEPSGTTWRDQIRRLTRDDPLLFTGMDVLLGTPGDAPISVWEEMFLPMTLRDAVREVSVTDASGSPQPLVLAEQVVVEGSRGSEPQGPPSWLLFYLALGCALGGLMAWSGTARPRWAGVVSAVAATTWSLAAGFVGTILVLVLLTDHTFMYRNGNLFLLTPLSLALGVLVPLGRWREGARRAAERLALVVLGLAVLGMVVGLLPWTGQDNAIFLALALPVHAGLWWSLRPTPR